jgi:hypothetical protein
VGDAADEEEDREGDEGGLWRARFDVVDCN